MAAGLAPRRPAHPNRVALDAAEVVGFQKDPLVTEPIPVAWS